MPLLDVRLPLGLLFLTLGLILVGYGLTADTAIYAKHSLGRNVNLAWGAVFALFGIVMLALARRTARANKRSTESAPGAD